MTIKLEKKKMKKNDSSESFVHKKHKHDHPKLEEQE